MDLTIKASNCWHAAREGLVSEARARRDVLVGRGAGGDFTVMHTDLHAFERTRFKAYAGRGELLLAVSICDRADPFDRGDDLEVFFDPLHDHLGYFQFLFDREGGCSCYTHMPYEEARSTAFPWLVPRSHDWGGDEAPDVVGARRPMPWLFVRFPLEGVFRTGGRCGFNVARYSCGLREPQSWNRFTGNRLQDATGFGHLYAGATPCEVRVTRAAIALESLELEGTLSPPARELSLRLVDPLGEARELAVRVEGAAWRAAAAMGEPIPGRYRIYPAVPGTAHVEPDFLFFDVDDWPRTSRRYSLCMTYDVPDDIRSNAYTPERLDAQLAQLRACGIGRVYWIDYPPYDEFRGFWDWASVTRHVRATEKHCGDTLPLAARLSKARGMEFVGIFKPFDLGFTGPYKGAVRSERDAAQRGFVREIDGRYDIAWPPIAAHPEWTMAAHEGWTDTAHGPLASLRLASEDPIPAFRAQDIELWTSADNAVYRRYRGRVRIRQGDERVAHCRWTPAGPVPEPGTRREWFIELGGLSARARFVAVRLRGAGVRLTGRRFLLATARDAERREIRSVLSTSGGVEEGFLFRSPWSWANYTEAETDRVAWEGGALALALGERARLPTLLEPACPEARALWLGQVERILRTDADGVDIRTLCHHNTATSWLRFAFAEPVRALFRERFGWDARPVAEDFERVRRLRGECYTTFIREASVLARRYGKTFGVHLEPGIEVPAGMNVRMGMTIEWARWIEEGLLDEITLKYWSPQSGFVHEEILPRARRAGIRVYHSESNFALMTPRAAELAEATVLGGRSAGLSGFAFYETCSYFSLNAEGVSWPIGSADLAIARTAALLDWLRAAGGPAR